MASNESKRIEYFDYLRVFAALGVILAHVAAQNWGRVGVNTFEWKVFNAFDIVSRYCVPMFVMVSGALFVGREIPLKKLYFKHILRLVIVFVVWSVLYYFTSGGTIKLLLTDTTAMLSVIIKGAYHMWFLLMMIALYMVIPFMNQIAKNDTILKYFLILSAIFAFVLPTLSVIISYYGNGVVKGLFAAVSYDVDTMRMFMVLGYPGYFLLGYYLNRITLSKKMRIVLYVSAILFSSIAVILSNVAAARTGALTPEFLEEFSVAMLVESAAVFTLFKYAVKDGSRIYPFIKKLSEYTFGAYLVHVLVIDLLNYRLGINTLFANPLISVPALVLLVYVLSTLVAFVLKQIPFIKKYLV